MKTYDIIVIGAGPVGLATAMYSGRLGMETLLLGKSIGGTILLTEKVENYPGFKSISSAALIEQFKDHAMDYKDKVKIMEREVIDIGKQEGIFHVRTNKEEFSCKAVVFTTGAKHKELEVSGSHEFLNKGVHYCALCDGPLYSGKVVAVIGGGDSAVIEALTLSKYAKKVYIVNKKAASWAESRNLDRMSKAKNVEIINNTNIAGIEGDKFVSRIILDRPYKGKKELALEAVFVAIGYIPISILAEKLGVELNEKRQIKINRRSETNAPGVYAAGDVTDAEFKQIITGVGEGVAAAFHASKFVG
ncbi:hypothetical protein A3K63_00200 [Candidatus Micrarchaeota archaeon RBG_16_49_10]|nr:MAG: hypothetical protein A3K63_00200 [Candidatus Micrarchaeota archaeon RBG_16_49_10]